MNDKKAMLKYLLLLLSMIIGGLVLSKVISSTIRPIVESQSEEGNLTFLFLSILVICSFFNNLVYGIGNARTRVFTDEKYILADMFLPVWNSFKLKSYTEDFTDDIEVDNVLTYRLLNIIPKLNIVNSIMFWLITIFGFIYLELTYGTFDFIGVHGIYVLVVATLYVLGIIYRSLTYDCILYSMECALSVFRVDRAIIISLVLPVACLLNVILIILGLFGIGFGSSITILNLAFVLIIPLEPVITTVQLVMASNEASLNILENEED